jgi:hypothetical protein
MLACLRLTKGTPSIISFAILNSSVSCCVYLGSLGCHLYLEVIIIPTYGVLTVNAATGDHNLRLF